MSLLLKMRELAMRYRGRWAMVVALSPMIIVGACGSSPQNRQNYADTPKAVAFGVAAAGVHRAITGGCWAQCTHGLVCEEESGTCVPQEQLARRRNAKKKRSGPPADPFRLVRCECEDAGADTGDAGACSCEEPADAGAVLDAGG